MAYIGQDPVIGRYIIVDQISGGFNGTASGFTLAAGGQGVIPGLAQNVLLSLGGVIQQPGTDYTVSGSGITFTTPPLSGTTFFATVLGDVQAVGTPSDGTVLPASIATSGTFVFPNLTTTGTTLIASGNASTPSLAIIGDTNTGIYSPGADQVAISTNGTQRLTVDTAATTSTLPVVHPLGAVGTPSITFTGDLNTGIYSPAADTIAFAEGGVEAMRIDSSGRLGLGTSSPSEKLEVVGNIRLTGNQALIFQQPSGVAVGAVSFKNSAGVQKAAIASYYNVADEGAIEFVGPTNGTNVIIRSDGKVGIGTSVPGSILDIRFSTNPVVDNGGGADALRVWTSSALAADAGGAVSFGGVATSGGAFASWAQIAGRKENATSGAYGGYLQFAVNTGSGTMSERARLTSDGKFLVGTSSGSGNNYLQIQGDAGGATGTGGISLRRNVAPSGMGEGSTMGIIDFGPNDGGVGARITGVADAQQGTNDYSGRLVFSTTANGASSPTERFRIGSAGQLGIGGATYGTSGQVLTSGGASAAPTWSAVPSPAALTTASGSAPSYSARAWVNFDGTANTNLTGTYSQSGTTVTVTATAHGLIAGNTVFADITSGTGVDGDYTVATVTNANTFTYTAGTSLTTSGNITIRRNTIRGSGNVSSITDNGTGDYTVNFTTALADANYCAVVTGSSSDQGSGCTVMDILGSTAPTASAIRVLNETSAGGNVDSEFSNVAIFR